MKQKKEEITFSDIISIFAPKVWVIVIISLVLAALMGVYSVFFKAKTYTSTTTMYVYRSSTSPTPNDLELAERMIETYIIYLNSDDALKEVITRIPNDYENKNNLTTSYVKQSASFSSKGYGVFEISITTNDPVVSFYIAKSFEVVAVERIKLNVPNALPIQIIQTPVYSSTPNGKGTVKNVLVGFFAGGILSSVAVFSFSLFDSIIRSKKKIEDNLTIPVLGVIPVFNQPDKSNPEV